MAGEAGKLGVGLAGGGQPIAFEKIIFSLPQKGLEAYRAEGDRLH